MHKATESKLFWYAHLSSSTGSTNPRETFDEYVGFRPIPPLQCTEAEKDSPGLKRAYRGSLRARVSVKNH